MRGHGARARRWRWVLVFAVVGVLGLTVGWWLPPLQEVVGGYLALSWPDKDQRASVVGALFGGLSLVASIMLGVAQLRQASRLTDPGRGMLDAGQDADRRLRAPPGTDQNVATDE